jgi:hypothetical protein
MRVIKVEFQTVKFLETPRRTKERVHDIKEAYMYYLDIRLKHLRCRNIY